MVLHKCLPVRVTREIAKWLLLLITAVTMTMWFVINFIIATDALNTSALLNWGTAKIISSATLRVALHHCTTKLVAL